MKYTRSATVGSVALDLGYLERRAAAERTLDRPYEPRTLPRVRQEEKTRTRARAREQQSVSLFAVTGFAAVAVLCVLLLFSYVRLTELSDSVVTLRNQYTDLKANEASLLAEYESAFDLSAIEEEAMAEGMKKPQSGQVYYLDLSGPDKAVVYNTEKTGFAALLANVGKGFYTAVEYFR
ncbi:hypothetical protein [Papillibacter cinnamivorans]|uniref:hypothetical protein n=1 Tax=Papillibacter cinnamivorans TaxID=100176 RepID=UPI0009FDA122|nr:hypothetical protein [Papillibacter cinnamivorans]